MSSTDRAATGTGARRFLASRMSAAALLALTLFAVPLAVSLIGAGHPEIAGRLGNPLIAVPLMAFVVVAAYHMYIGLREVIEDYLDGRHTRRWASIGNAVLSLSVVGGAGYPLISLMLR